MYVRLIPIGRRLIINKRRCIPLIKKWGGVRRKSASGGVAYTFYLTAIANGYKAIGTYFDNTDKIAKTCIASDAEEIHKFRGSKYLQAYQADAIKQAIHSKDKYIVIGMPCEIAGYRKAIELYHCENRFILVDLFCHGVPSYLAWNKYLEDTAGNEELKAVSFRDQTHGWHKNYQITLQTTSGIHTEERSKCAFYNIFDDSYLMNDICYDCNICQRYGYADVRIGDNWDQEKCADGVFRSLVCIGTSKGEELWEKAKENLSHELCKKRLVNKNRIPPKCESVRQTAISLLKSDLPLQKVVKRYRKKEVISIRMKRNKALVAIIVPIKKCIRKFRRTQI